MRLDLFRKKSVKPDEDSSGLEVVPTEVKESSFPEAARTAGEIYPEVVPDDFSNKPIPVTNSLKRKPIPNKDVSLEVPPAHFPQQEQPGLETPNRDIPPFLNFPSQPQQLPPPNAAWTPPATQVPAYAPPEFKPNNQGGGPVIRTPGLWEQRFDPANNAPFYINHTTKQTSWVLPPGDLLESQVDLPPGWEIRFTYDGLRYFLDRSTNTTSFKDPRIFKRPEVNAQGRSVERHPVTGEPVGSLPPGWKRKVDKKGRAYFLNAQGKVASFEDPRSGKVEYDRGSRPGGGVIYK